MDDNNREDSSIPRISTETSKDNSAALGSPGNGAMDDPEARRATLKSKVIFQLATIGIVAVVVTLLYELINERIFSNTVLWGSHIGAVLCSAITVMITAYVILKKYQVH